MDKFDISFLQEYLEVNGISITKFGECTCISRAHLYRAFNGETISKKQLDKILHVLKVDTYEELKEKVNETKIPNNISVESIKAFLKENEISNKEFMEYLEISKAELYRILSGSVPINKKIANKIDRMFETKTLEKIDYKISKIEEIEKGIYDISFLKEYLKISGIPVSKFSRYIGINRNDVNKILAGKALIEEKELKSTLELFNSESYSELKEIVRKELDAYNKNLETKKIDLEEVRAFLEENKISNIKFSKYLGISKAKLYRIYSGQIKMPENVSNKIYKMLDQKKIV